MYNTQHVSSDAHALTDSFCYECGMRRLPWMTAYFQANLSKGLSIELLEELIQRTAHAPRPSYAYLDYLVQMCVRSGINSTLDLLIKPHSRPEKYEELPI